MRLPRYSGGDVGAFLNRLVLAIEQQSGGHKARYAITGDTPTRTLHVGTATAGDVANVLATVISDLQAGGL